MKINTRSQLTLVFQDVAVFHPRPCNPEEVPGWLELADCLKADTSPVCLGVIEEAVAAAKVYLGDGDLVVGVPWGDLTEAQRCSLCLLRAVIEDYMARMTSFIEETSA